MLLASKSSTARTSPRWGWWLLAGAAAVAAAVALVLMLAALTDCGASSRRWAAPLHRLTDPGRGTDNVTWPTASTAAGISLKSDPLPAGVGAADAAAVGEQWHPLYKQIERDLEPYKASGISLRMVEQAYCSSRNMGLRFQVIDGRAYAAGEAGEWQSRLLGIMRQLLAVSHRWRLPDVDIVLEQNDMPTETETSEACPERGPLVANTKRTDYLGHTHVLLAPDHGWAEWVETRTLSWAEQLQIADTAEVVYPWQQRQPSLMFRGIASGGLRPALGHSIWLWHEAHEGGNASAGAPPVFDVLMTGEVHDHGGQAYKSLLEHCSYKYLLHAPGNSYAARLRYLLACGSVVFRLQMDPWIEFFYPLLQHESNVIELDPAHPDTLTDELAAWVHRLRANDTQAAALGAAAREVATDALRPDRVLQYWRRLLTQYAALQTFKPQLHQDAIPLEQAVLVRRNWQWSYRSCPMCPGAE